MKLEITKIVDESLPSLISIMPKETEISFTPCEEDNKHNQGFKTYDVSFELPVNEMLSLALIDEGVTIFIQDLRLHGHESLHEYIPREYYNTITIN